MFQCPCLVSGVFGIDLCFCCMGVREKPVFGLVFHRNSTHHSGGLPNHPKPHLLELRHVRHVGVPQFDLPLAVIGRGQQILAGGGEGAAHDRGRVAVEHVNQMAFNGVPQSHAAVRRARRQQVAVWREGHRIDDVGVASDGLEAGGVNRVPDPHRVVGGARGHARPHGRLFREARDHVAAAHRLGVALVGAHALAGGEVPQLEVPVLARAHHVLAVAAQLEAQDGARVPLQRVHQRWGVLVAAEFLHEPVVAREPLWIVA